jgi:hypothetical protein
VNTCNDCGKEPHHPGSVVRLVGKDAAGNVITLCSRCFIRRERDAALPTMQLKKKGKNKR